MSYDMDYMWNLKTHGKIKHIENKLVVTKGKGRVG